MKGVVLKRIMDKLRMQFGVKNSLDANPFLVCPASGLFFYDSLVCLINCNREVLALLEFRLLSLNRYFIYELKVVKINFMLRFLTDH